METRMTIAEYRRHLSIVCENQILQRTTIDNLQKTQCGCFRILGVVEKISEKYQFLCKSCQLVYDTLSDDAYCKKCGLKCEIQRHIEIELKDHTKKSVSIFITNLQLLQNIKDKDLLLNSMCEFGVSKQRNSKDWVAIASRLVQK